MQKEYRRQRGQCPQVIWLLAIVVPFLLSAQRAPAQETDPPVNEPPSIYNCSAAPTELWYTAGEVNVHADITDDSGLDESLLYAVAEGSDGTSVYTLLFTSAGATFVMGTLGIPENKKPTPVRYKVTVYATDLDGARSSATIAQEIFVHGQPVDEPPKLTDLSVEPRELTSAGGTVTIQTTATDEHGFQDLYAQVTRPDGSKEIVLLSFVSTFRYKQTYDVPANTGSTAVQYRVEVTAVDDSNQVTTVDAGVITVAAPIPPLPGRLKVSRDTLSFGKVTVGWRSRLSVVLRHQGKKGTALLTGVVATPGAPFSLVGAGTAGLPFRLRAGEARKFTVQFRPSSLGDHSGVLAIQRADGGQPGLVLRLKGRGVRTRRR